MQVYVTLTITFIIVALLVRHYVAFVVRVESVSMEPTFRHGQLLFARRVHKNTLLKKGDVVVVNSKELGRTIIKRLAGTPGEIIKVEGKTYHIPDDHYFLLGDNAKYSSDSRRWHQPYITRASIIGKL